MISLTRFLVASVLLTILSFAGSSAALPQRPSEPSNGQAVKTHTFRLYELSADGETVVPHDVTIYVDRKAHKLKEPVMNGE